MVFLEEIKEFLTESKNDFKKNYYERIDEFLNEKIGRLRNYNETFIGNLEKLNFMNLPEKNDQTMFKEITSLKGELEYMKEVNEKLITKSSRLQNELDLFFNRQSGSDHNQGLKKTMAKIIELDKKVENLESKERSYVKQILLLKDENLKLFVD